MYRMSSAVHKLRRADVVRTLGIETVARIYSHADALHCEPIERVADEFATFAAVPTGDYDNVATCRYDSPDYWAIGEVCERLILDVSADDPVSGVFEVHSSWIDELIGNYNSDCYHQPRDCLRECNRAGAVLE